MKHGKKYDEFLIRESKYGRKNSYINLCHIYVYKVFSVVLKLIPIKEATVKISSEVFVVAWRNIQKVESSEEFEKYLEKITAVRCAHYLTTNNVKPLDDLGIDLLSKEFNNPISILEKEILTLSNDERVLIVLCDQLGMNTDNISKIYKNFEPREIITTLNNTRQKLLEKLNPEIFNQFSEEDWDTIENSLQKIVEDDTFNSDSNQKELTNKFLDASKELLNDLFLAIVPHQEIIDNLTGYLHKEENNEKKEVVNEKDIIETEILLEDNTQKIRIKNENNKVLVPKKKLDFKNKYVMAVIGLSLLTLLLLLIPKKIDPWKTAAKIKGNNVNEPYTEIQEKEKITVGKNEEKVVIQREDVVSIEILENSELRISKVSNNENVLELKFGSINFNSILDSKNNSNGETISYLLKVPFATISTVNSSFHYEEIKWKGFRLVTNKGWLSLTIDKSKRKIYCGNNYIFDYNDSYQMGVPYYKKASKTFINAIKEISMLPTNNNAFKYIVDNAEENDALTLWHLLYISDIGKKRLIIKRLDKLLLLDISKRTADGNQISKEAEQDLLEFIKSDLLMQ